MYTKRSPFQGRYLGRVPFLLGLETPGICLSKTFSHKLLRPPREHEALWGHAASRPQASRLGCAAAVPTLTAAPAERGADGADAGLRRPSLPGNVPGHLGQGSANYSLWAKSRVPVRFYWNAATRVCLRGAVAAPRQLPETTPTPTEQLCWFLSSVTPRQVQGAPALPRKRTNRLHWNFTGTPPSTEKGLGTVHNRLGSCGFRTVSSAVALKVVRETAREQLRRRNAKFANLAIALSLKTSHWPKTAASIRRSYLCEESQFKTQKPHSRDS